MQTHFHIGVGITCLQGFQDINSPSCPFSFVRLPKGSLRDLVTSEFIPLKAGHEQRSNESFLP